MTDRISALTVILEKDVREDEIEPTIAAIQQIKGVLSVQTHVTGVADVVAYSRAKQKVLSVLDGVLRAL